MSAFDYDPIKATSLALIARFGRDITIRTTVSSGTPYDPTLTDTDTVVKGAVVDFNDSQIDGTLIQRGDKKIILQSDIVVNSKTKIIDESVTYAVENNRIIKPGGTRLIQIIQVRSIDS